MSDNSNSTGSSASSTNSWTILSPEEAAVESLGPVDDGTESLGDVPSLSEELAGAILEVKPCEAEAAVETVLTEEGLQVCQETAPDEASEGPVPSSPAPVSPVPSSPAHLSPSTSSHVLYDPESQPPIIHDMVTSSPSDDHQLAAIPVDLVTPLDSPFAEPPSAEFETGLNFPVSESPTSASLLVSPFVKPPSAENESEYTVTADSESPIPAVLTPDISIDTLLPAETLVLDDPVLSAEPNTSLESLSESGPPSDVYTDISPSLDVLETPESPTPETVEEEPAVEKEETEHPEKEAFPPFDFGQVDASKEEDGLRRRNVPPSEPPRPRTSDEEDDEEMEFRLAEKKDEKPGGLSLTTCIIGALVLLCLGSLFLTDDDSSELSDGNQDWSSDDVTNLLDKLAQENQEISHLEAQLQSQEEELDSALKASTAKEKGEEDLEKENAKLKEDLSSMPGLKEELEALRARVAEISQLTASDDMPTPMASSTPPPSGKPEESQPSAKDPERKGSPKDGGKMKEELQRQKVLLEESRKRLEGMKRGGGHRKGVREGLANVQKRLTEQVEKLGKKKPWEASKWNAKKGKDNGKAHWKKGEKDLRHDKDDHHNGGGKDWKHKQNSHKQNSHKEAWRKNQDEWDRKKDERRSDREKRKQDRPWYKRPTKDSNNHHHHHHHRQPLHEHHQHHHQTHPAQQYDATFWKHQQEKLSRNVRPRSSCGSADECADQEGLYPVELAEFEELLEGYLSKLEVATPVNKDKLRKLIGQFFVDGVFVHDRILFSEFAEDVADILEDMADVGEEDPTDDDALEEEMEEFEREALWKFAVAA